MTTHNPRSASPSAALTKQEVEWLVEGVLITHDGEIGCDDCLERVGAYAETVLAGLTVPEALRAVEAHLAICGECEEEYEALLLALRDGSVPPAATDP